MADFEIESLLRKTDDGSVAGRIGRASSGNIDKTGHFYHVITKSFDGGPVFQQDIGEYRHTLLCSLCEQRDITILFSVTMPNHTHEVLLVPDWNLLMNTYMVLDRTIVRMIRLRNPKKYRSGVRVLRRYPVYVALKDIVTLFYEGKYVYDNPAHLRREGKYVPYSCFWMFEKGHFVVPYDEKIYEKLLGLTYAQILDLFATKTKIEVLEYARQLYADWTDADNRRVFIRSNVS